MNSTWHTSYQLQKVMWCESFTSFKSRAASESIQRRKTVFPQKIACVRRNSLLNCRSNALLMWNNSNYSHFTSSNVFMLYPLGQPKEFPSFVCQPSLREHGTAILLEGAGGWPIYNIQGHSGHSSLTVLSAWFMLYSLHSVSKGQAVKYAWQVSWTNFQLLELQTRLGMLRETGHFTSKLASEVALLVANIINCDCII